MGARVNRAFTPVFDALCPRMTAEVVARLHRRSETELATGGPMTTTDHPAEGHAWLVTSTTRTASDVLLSCVLLVAGAIAMWDGRGASFGREGLNAGFFPMAVGAIAAAVGILLLGRSAFFRRPQPAPWRLRHIAIIAAAVVAIIFAAWQWGLELLLLQFGPPEHAALTILLLMGVIALARWSRLRAVGMLLLGLLLSAVGIDVMTGQLRLTMGLEPLIDGIAPSLVLIGLIVVGDGLVCLVSPSLWLATYAWLRPRPHQPQLPMAATIAARAVAALAIAAACYFAFALNGETWDIGLLLAIGLFGVICKLFGWNRLLLIMGCIYGTALEQSLRQSMVLSQGDPAVFFLRPISATLLVACLGLVALVIVLAARRSLLRRRAAPVAP
jgi:hypothetical protein